MLESVVSARGKVLRTNFSATSRVTRATKLTQAASRHSYRWCSPPTRGSATTFAVGDGRCVTALKLGVSLFSPKLATVLMIVADVSSHEPDEMTCAENHDVLKELATASCRPRPVPKLGPFEIDHKSAGLDALGIRAESRVFRAAGLTSDPWGWRMNK